MSAQREVPTSARPLGRTSPDPVERLRAVVLEAAWELSENPKATAASVLAAIVEELGVTEDAIAALQRMEIVYASSVANRYPADDGMQTLLVAYSLDTLLRASRTEDAPHAD